MKEITVHFRDRLVKLLDTVVETETSNILQAAKLICDAIQQERRIHILGTGAHSQLAVEEVLWRAGGLACWNPILDPGTSLLHGAKRSVSFERMPGYGVAVLNAYEVGATRGEILILINAYGIDPMSIDVALECRKRGVKTIGITSPSYGRELPTDSPVRHPSGKNLFEEVDLFINSHMPFGDAVVEVEGLAQRTGSVSTMCSVFIMDALVCEIVAELVLRGETPPVFVSANLPESESMNAQWEQKYSGFARYLL